MHFLLLCVWREWGRQTVLQRFWFFYLHISAEHAPALFTLHVVVQYWSRGLNLAFSEWQEETKQGERGRSTCYTQRWAERWTAWAYTSPMHGRKGSGMEAGAAPALADDQVDNAPHWLGEPSPHLAFAPAGARKSSSHLWFPPHWQQYPHSLSTCEHHRSM